MGLASSSCPISRCCWLEPCISWPKGEPPPPSAAHPCPEKTPQPSMLPAQGSDSVCSSGLWVWMSHFSPWQQQLFPTKGFFSLPSTKQRGRCSRSLFTEQCLSPSGHKLPAELPGSSLGFLETQRPAWQAQSQPTGLLSQHSSDHCMRFALQSICSCARGWGVFFNLCFFH